MGVTPEGLRKQELLESSVPQPGLPKAVFRTGSVPVENTFKEFRRPFFGLLTTPEQEKELGTVFREMVTDQLTDPTNLALMAGPGALGMVRPANLMPSSRGKGTRVFHGTAQKFEKFDPQQFGKGAGGDLYGPGVYLTDNPKIASYYRSKQTQGIADDTHWKSTLKALNKTKEELLAKSASPTRIAEVEKDIKIAQKFFDSTSARPGVVRAQRIPHTAKILDADNMKPEDVQKLIERIQNKFPEYRPSADIQEAMESGRLVHARGVDQRLWNLRDVSSEISRELHSQLNKRNLRPDIRSFSERDANALFWDSVSELWDGARYRANQAGMGGKEMSGYNYVIYKPEILNQPRTPLQKSH